MDSLTLLYDCKTKVLQRFFIAKNNKQKHRFLHVPQKISIKVTEAQPLPCPYCNGFYGYQYSDLFRMSYTSVHNSDGTYSGGEYSDGVSLNKSKTAYCVNCGTKLPFTLIREGEEQVE